jgi:hypothetical protein
MVIRPRFGASLCIRRRCDLLATLRLNPRKSDHA